MFGESNLLWWLYLAAILVIICYHWLLRNRIEIITREVLLDSETGNFFWFDIFFDTFWAFSFFGFLWFTFFFWFYHFIYMGFVFLRYYCFFFWFFAEQILSLLGPLRVSVSLWYLFLYLLYLCVSMVALVYLWVACISMNL